jgi:hypothetical protein
VFFAFFALKSSILAPFSGLFDPVYPLISLQICPVPKKYSENFIFESHKILGFIVISPYFQKKK